MSHWWRANVSLHTHTLTHTLKNAISTHTPTIMDNDFATKLPAMTYPWICATNEYIYIFDLIHHLCASAQRSQLNFFEWLLFCSLVKLNCDFKFCVIPLVELKWSFSGFVRKLKLYTRANDSYLSIEVEIWWHKYWI